MRGHVRHLRFLGDVVLLAVANYHLARLGLSVGSLPGNVAPVWPPAGFALAVLLVRGRRLWPGVALGALAVNGLGVDVPLTSAAGMAAGNTLAAVVAVTVLGRLGFRLALDRSRDAAALVVVVVLTCGLSATAGTLSLRVGGVLSAAGYWTAWRTWWLGDGLGGLVVGPALLAAFTVPLRGRLRPRLELTVFLVVVAVSGLRLIGPAGYPYLALPLVAWGAVRWGLPGASLTTLFTAAVAVIRANQGNGPFAGAPTALLRLDGFLPSWPSAGWWWPRWWPSATLPPSASRPPTGIWRSGSGAAQRPSTPIGHGWPKPNASPVSAAGSWTSAPRRSSGPTSCTGSSGSTRRSTRPSMPFWPWSIPTTGPW